MVHDLNADLDRAANVTARQQYLAGEIHAAALGLANSGRGSVLSAVLGNQPKSAEHLSRFRSLSDELGKAVAELDRLIDRSQVGSLLEGLKQQAADVRAAGEEISKALSSQQMDVALKIFGDKLEPRLRDIDRQASSLVAQQNGSLAKVSAAAHAKSSRSRSITIGLGLLALVAGVLVLGIVRQANRAFRLAASRLAKNAELVSTAASNVSESSRVLATEASEQAASLEETSASTEEITCITRQNADHAGQVAALMVQNQQGIGQVDESLDRMVEQMKEMHVSSNKVVSIIKVIDSIAFQTNIIVVTN